VFVRRTRLAGIFLGTTEVSTRCLLQLSIACSVFRNVAKNKGLRRYCLCVLIDANSQSKSLNQRVEGSIPSSPTNSSLSGT
jgi:hypothetical protein